MKLQRILTFLGISFSLLLGFFGQQSVQAADGPEYYLRAMSTNSAQTASNGYYKIRTIPGGKQEVQVQIGNKKNSAIKLQLDVNTAYTQNSGIYGWNRKKVPADTTRQYNLADLVQPRSQTVTIPAKGTVVAKFTLTPPSKAYSGIIMGGIYTTPMDGTRVSVNANTALSIKYSYAVPIVLKMDNVLAVPSLTALSARGGIHSGATAVLAKIQNPKPALLDNATMNLSVTRRGSSTVLHATKGSGLIIAPNSNFDYPIDWGGDRLEAGDYTLHGTASNGSQSWKFTRNFTISASEADQLNREAGFKPNYLWLWITLGVLALILLILLVFWLGRRSSKKKTDSNE